MTQPPDRVPCKMCREGILPGARKCIHCESYQGWLAFLNIGTPVLALLVALVSVVIAGLPPMLQALTPTADRLRVRLIGVDPDTQSITLFVTNVGNAAAAIRSVTLMAPPEASIRTTVRQAQLELPESRLVGAGESREFILKADGGVIPREPKRTDAAWNFQLRVDCVRFSGELQSFTVSFEGAIR